jgi:RimJ/RimL family protein N-acetyltransferase
MSTENLTKDDISIRPLTAADVAAYRALRQRVLDLGDGKYFSDSYTREATLDEPGWREWCTEKPDHCIMGTFDRDRLIGVMMITQHGEPAANTVEWEAIWLEPDYRGKKIASLAYREVWHWSTRHDYDTVALFIRADNQHSIDIHRALGAVYQYTKDKPEIWADGSIANVEVYQLRLTAPTLEQALGVVPMAKLFPVAKIA